MIKIQPIPATILKQIPQLLKKKHRDEEGLFLVEGIKCIEETLKHTSHIEYVVIEENSFSQVEDIIDTCKEKKIQLYYSTKSSFSNFTDTVTPQPIVAVAKKPQSKPDFSGDVLVLDGIQDPGNIGTILRTAQWFGIQTIVLSNQCADIWSPKVVRAATGSLFAISFVRTASLVDTLHPLRFTHSILATSLQGSIQLSECVFDKPTVFIMGSEAQGVSSELCELAHNTVFIPSVGDNKNTESLNVAIATALCCYQLTLTRK